MRSKLESTKVLREMQTAISEYLAKDNQTSDDDTFVANLIIEAKLCLVYDEELISATIEHLHRKFKNLGQIDSAREYVLGKNRRRLREAKNLYSKLIRRLKYRDKGYVVRLAESVIEDIKF